MSTQPPDDGPIQKMHEVAGTHDLKLDERIDLPARQRCMFGNREDHCGQPATAHIWVGDDYFTMGCDDHLWWWKAHPFKDSHHIGACCGLPGTFWLFTTATEPGRCLMEGLSDLAADLASVPMAEVAL